MNTVCQRFINASFLIVISFQSLLASAADTVLTDGKILTVDENFTVADSLAIEDGRIIAVGDTETIKALITADTQVIALDGKTVIPGLIDNHFHFIRGVWNFQTEARLDGVSSREEAKALLQARATAAGPGQWVTVMGGWTGGQFLDDSSPFTLEELDTLAPENPVFLMRNYSEAYANSAALALAGLTPSGEARLSGRDSVSALVNQVTWRNKAASAEAIKRYMSELNRIGLTTVYDVGRPSEGKHEPLAILSQEMTLPVRVFHTLRYSANNDASTADAIDLIEGGDIKPRSNDYQFGLIGLGEHIYLPVSDNPRHTGLWSADDWGPFSQISTAAARHGWPVHEHVMSRDTALQYLDLIDSIAKDIPAVNSLRWTFAHVNGMQDADISRAADAGIALAVHSQARMSLQTSDAPRLGSIARSGALWGLGSDAGIVASYLPFATLEWAVAGTNIAGEPLWSADQRVSREEALRAHTLNNAHLLFMEDHLGSLEVGKLADLLVLDKDYMSINETDIGTIRPLMTMTGGIIGYGQ